MESLQNNPYPSLEYVDSLIAVGNHSGSLREALLVAAEQTGSLPSDEQYEYVHALADRSRFLDGIYADGEATVYARTGVESAILDKVFEIPGIHDDSDKIFETCVRQLKCLHRDYGSVYFATRAPSYRNELRAEIWNKRREYALHVRALMRETGRYDAHIDHLAVAVIRSRRVRRVVTLQVSSLYL